MSAKQPANEVAAKLQQASELFGQMAADASLDKGDFKVKYGKMLLPMFQALTAMLGDRLDLDPIPPPYKN